MTDILDLLKNRAAEARRRAERTSAAAVVCSHVPRELVEAFFPRVVRLSPSGTVEREAEGEKRSGPFVCSYCKAILGADRYPSIIIGSSSCDQMKRALEIGGRRSGRPPAIINMPATRSGASLAYFKTEVRWLAEELAGRAGRAFDVSLLKKIIRLRNEIRSGMRKLRRRLGGAEWTALVLCESLLGTDEMADVLKEAEKTASRPPSLKILLAGSPLTLEEIPFLEFIESRGASVSADATCTGDRAVAFNVRASGSVLDGLAAAYFRRPPCIRARPNDEFYKWVREMAQRRGIKAVIWRTVRNCDIWSLEAQRARTLLGLPLLTLDTTYGDVLSTRVGTRVEAFLESLV